MKKITSHFKVDDWLLIATGLASIVIGVLDFLGWIQLSLDQLFQIALVGLGLLMSTAVIQASKQASEKKDLFDELEKYVIGQSDVKRFNKAEFGFEYMAKKIRGAKVYVDHASLSPPIPRWYSSVPDFEKAIRQTAIANQVKMRYLANFSDKARLKRVAELLNTPGVNRYFAATFTAEELTIHMMNIMIVDGEELILGIHGFGEQDSIVAIKNEQVVLAFSQYFDLLWSKANPVDKTSLVNYLGQ